MFFVEQPGGSLFINESAAAGYAASSPEDLPSEPAPGVEINTLTSGMPVGKPAPANPPTPAWDDEGPPLWPDDWEQFEQPVEDAYFQPANPAPQAAASWTGTVQPASLPMEQPLVETTFGEIQSSQPEQIVRAQLSAASDLSNDYSSGETQAPPFLSMPFFVPASTMAIASSDDGAEDEDREPRQLTVILRSGTDKGHDVRRLRRIHGTLRSYPGKDKFAFLVFENGRRFLMEFPNDTTGICSELIRKIIELVGEGNVRVEPIKIQ
jgi:hypothetical protein